MGLRGHADGGQKRDELFHRATGSDMCCDGLRSIGTRCSASLPSTAEFSTTTSLIWWIDTTSVKLAMSALISWACGPNDDWYASTESHSRWHMATYAPRGFPSLSASPLSMA